MSIFVEKEYLEQKLSFQELLINRLLEITQAINDNYSIDNLFKIYEDTLSWLMGIQRFALYSCMNQDWDCVVSSNLDMTLENIDVERLSQQYKSPLLLKEEEDSVLAQFKWIIPVYHKKQPIAFTFISEGNWNSENVEEVYNTIRFISAITNVIAVAIENKRLFKRQLKQEAMKRELELAFQVQSMLIPSQLPNNELYQFSGIYQPHNGVGGDYYDFLDIGGREIAFCIADISGKGISAALLMSNFQANLQSLIHRKYLSVRKFANRLNSLVLKATQGERFITFFIARYHMKKKRLRYICAGHNPPFMYSKGKVQRLDKGCTVLGVFPKIPYIEYGEVYLDDDALFFLYTDGLTDLQDEEGNFFDDQRLETFLNAHQHLDPEELNKQLMEEIHRFKGNNGFPDDISVLTGRVFTQRAAQLKSLRD